MADVLWTWDALVGVSGGVADGAPALSVTGFSIDTRSLLVGDVFVALKDQRDGHEFVSVAFGRGAAAALVERGYQRKPGDGALIRVDDTLKALERIGVAARERLSPDAKVIAVTGSAGKTGTKEMLRACLATAGKVHAPDKSFNNHWGVPLTLARMPADTEFGVFEIGMNHAGEIRPLTRMVRPHVAIITNVLPVHIGNFPDGEVGIAKAKAEIFEGLEPGGVAVVPIESVHIELLCSAAQGFGAVILTFGRIAAARVQAVRLDADDAGTSIELVGTSEAVTYRLGVPGAHVAMNSVAVAAALDAVGVALRPALSVLQGVAAGLGRGQRVPLRGPDGGPFLLVDESYNANPTSMAAAIRTSAHSINVARPRLLIAIGDMLELGADEGRYHLALASVIDECKVDLVFACGPNMKLLFDTLPLERRGHWAPTSEGLIAPILDALRAGDVVMVKGSLGSRMGPIVDAIKKRFAAGGGSV